MENPEKSETIQKIDRRKTLPQLFKKGQSGNLKGRPKGRFSLTTLIIKQLEENPKQTQEIIEWILKEKRDLVWKMIDPEPPKDLNLGGEVKLPFNIIIEKDE